MLTREDLFAVVIRLMVLWIGWSTVVASINFMVHDQTRSDPPTLWLNLGIMAVLLLILGVIWLFPLSIARKLLPAAKDARSPLSADPNALVAAGVTVLGLYWLGGGLIGLFYSWQYLRVAEIVGVGSYLIPPETTAGLWTDGFQTVFGLAIMLSAKHLQQWLIPGPKSQSRLDVDA